MQLLYKLTTGATVYFVPRSEWGSLASTEESIRNRVKDSALGKTTIQIHHTAAIDTDDNTPNQWDYDEALVYMRRLQWSRPDLGPLPYSENLAVSEDGLTVWVFEGRGFTARGAHTAGHNVDGIGWGAFGNFDFWTPPEVLRSVIETIERRVAFLRANGFPNLGSEPSEKTGWPAWGHRDTTTKSCPGNYLYPLLRGFRLDIGDDMLLTQYLDRDAWEALIAAGLTPGPLDAVVKYWITDGHLRPLGEHITSSADLVRDIAKAIQALKANTNVDQTARNAATLANNRLEAIKGVL